MNDKPTERSAWGDPGEMLRHLSGRWTFQRTIEGFGAMDGAATFTPGDAGCLNYHEKGILKLTKGGEFPAERDYIFRWRKDGFDVLFKEDQPRLFQEISLAPTHDSGLSGVGDHLCVRDTYSSRYEFLPDGRFTIRHVVNGPAKDYVMVTTYTRDDTAWAEI